MFFNENLSALSQSFSNYYERDRYRYIQHIPPYLKYEEVLSERLTYVFFPHAV